MKKNPYYLRALERILVREFRISQTLFHSLEAERLAILQEDTTNLKKVSQHKEELLDQLGRLTKSKHQVLQELHDSLGLEVSLEKQNLIHSIVATVDDDTARRFYHLYEGVVVVMSQIRDLIRINQALTVTALNRANRKQVTALEDMLTHLNQCVYPDNGNHQKDRDLQPAFQGTTTQKTNSHLEPNPNILSIITDLNQQEAIYQSVLDSNTHTLSNV